MRDSSNMIHVAAAAYGFIACMRFCDLLAQKFSGHSREIFMLFCVLSVAAASLKLVERSWQPRPQLN